MARFTTITYRVPPLNSLNEIGVVSEANYRSIIEAGFELVYADQAKNNTSEAGIPGDPSSSTTICTRRRSRSTFAECHQRWADGFTIRQLTAVKVDLEAR